MILTKLSDPGWEKRFSTEEAARDELYKYVCFQCRCEEGLTETSDIDDMLGSACGCEFMLED